MFSLKKKKVTKRGFSAAALKRIQDENRKAAITEKAKDRSD